MKKVGRIVAPMTMATVMALSMAGYSQAASAASSSGNGVFTFYTIDDGAGFDPALFTWDARQSQIGIFEGLVHFGPNFSIAQGIATHWKANGKTWTFYLRHNARFSNGDPVVAQDFVYSIRRAVNPQTAAMAHKASSFQGDVPIKNAQKIMEGVAPVASLGVRAIGKYTVQFTLDRPDPTLLSQLATDMWQLPVDPRVVQGKPESIWTNPQTIVSDGPYMISSYVQGTQEILKPNPYYYAKVPLKEIKILPFSANANEYLTYQNNQSDTAILTPQDVPAVKNNPTMKNQLHWVQTAVSYTLQVSPSMNPAFSKLDVRQAFAEAVNKQVIAQNVLLGTGVPAYDGKVTSWMAPWIAKGALQYNPTQAQRLLAKAGYPGGKGFPTVRILTGSNPDPIAEAVAQMWQQTLGVNVQVDSENWGTYLADMKQVLPANEVGFTQFGQSAAFPDWKTIMPLDISGWQRTNVPLWSLSGAYAAQYAKLQSYTMAPGQKNLESRLLIARHESPQVRAVMALGVKAQATDNAALMQKYVIEKNHLAYVIPIYTVNNALLINPQVHGYYPMRMWLVTPPVWLGYITMK